MRKKIFTLLAIFLAFTAVTMQAQTVQDTTRHEVLLETDSGDIRIELFNETPKRIIFQDELPRNATGKVLKRKLKEQFQD